MQDDFPRCGAKTRGGEPCKNPPVTGGARCRMHGGKSKRGAEHHSAKTLKYSQYLPDRMINRYETSLGDTKLYELRSEVALVDARIADLLKRVDTGESGYIWQQTKQAFDVLRMGVSHQDTQAVNQAMQDLHTCIGKGTSDYAAWKEVQVCIEQRRRLVESERRHMKEMQQLVSIEQMMSLATALLGSIRMHVTECEQRAAIEADFTRLLGG